MREFLWLLYCTVEYDQMDKFVIVMSRVPNIWQGAYVR